MKRSNKKEPKCIGVIMDGNRRWAKEHKLSSLKGHTKGYEKLKELVSWSKELGVENVIVYAFSTENWKRSEKEVSYLLDLFRKIVKEFFESVEKEKIKIRFFGDISSFPKDLRDNIKNLEKKTEKYKDLNLFIALSYSGRVEILNAVKNLLKESKNKKINLTEKNFSDYMWSKGMPDPDIIIRTGGEMRLSNFLPWQSVYSELFFTRTYWPDFSEKEYKDIVSSYYERERRFGK
jgi:undecaprenyl diphosphate synthase